MALTGLIMIGFLLFHMYGNTKIFLGQEAFNEYAHHLRTMLEPIFPHEGFLWCFRAFMVITIVLHIFSAVKLWYRNTKARPETYKGQKFMGGGTYVPFLMRWGGVTIALFLVFHLLTFTTETIKVGYIQNTEPAMRMIHGFQEWWMVVLYAVVMVLVCLHVAHGVWSAFATLGANVSDNARKVLNVCAWVIAALIYFGFMAAPLFILFGGIK